MNRENQKIKYFEAYRYNWISEKIGEYKNYSVESLEEEIEALLIDVKEEQSKGKEVNPAYIILFFINTSLYTKSYKYMLIAADEGLYISKPIAVKYWIPDFVKEDAGLIRKELIQNKAKIPDLSKMEIEEGVRAVLKGYEGIISVLWKRAVEKALHDGIFKDMKEIPSILIGEYMGELKKVEIFTD